MVRYLISEKFVDPPNIPTGAKSKASYDSRHLAQLLLYQLLRKHGFDQKEILAKLESDKKAGKSPERALAEYGEVTHLLAPGIELKITTSLLSDIDPDALAQSILGILAVLGHSKQTERTDHAAHADQD